MEEKNFAFESEEVSVAFTLNYGMGDCIMAKKVFDALAELAPNCLIDIFCVRETHKTFAKAFYGGNKNLNLILNYAEQYQDNVQRYDLALNVGHAINIVFANVDKLQKAAPNLLQSLHGISIYNQKYFRTNLIGIVLGNIVRSHILGINRYTCLSCDGALPIYDNHVKISLTPEGKQQFERLQLNKNYITIGSNYSRGDTPKRHALKEWPADYAMEYISLLNRHLPQMEVVQVGGGGVIKLPNADRHILDEDMELVKCVLANSLLHVDCESGLVHLATQLGTKCLVLFGPTDAQYYAFKENLNLISDFCTPCYWAWENGSICMRGEKEPPCMLSIKPQQVFEVTRNYLRHLDLKNKA